MVRRILALCLFSLLFAALLRLPSTFDSPNQSVFVPQALAEENESNRRDYELIEVLSDVLDEIDRNYVHEVDRAELVEAAIHGMMNKLKDPHSKYVAEDKEKNALRRKLKAKYDGVGIEELAADGDSLRVVRPVVGSPAYEAGIRAGDQIMEIEGESTAGANLDDVFGRIQGKPGEEVEVTVFDAATQTTRKVKFKNSTIDVEVVFGATRKDDGSWNFMYDEQRKIGYLRLTSFSTGCAVTLGKAIDQLVADGVRGLVLDLRFNPGGYLPETFKVTELFLAKGAEIVTISSRGVLRGTHQAEKDGPLTEIPLAVLVNGESGSGSEIVAGCLQDVRANTVIVGQRTYGKGTVQSLIDLDEGRSFLKLTTAVYSRPSGKNIDRYTKGAKESDEWGVKPSEGFSVTLNKAENAKLSRYLLDRQAVESRESPESVNRTDEVSTSHDAVETQVVSTAVESEAPADKPAPGVQDAPNEPAAAEPSAEFVDRQFEKALVYLHQQLDQ